MNPFQFITNYFSLLLMKCPAFGLTGFSAALENRPEQSPQMKPIGAQSASVSKISATPQPFRPLGFQKRTFTVPIIMQFVTFSQT
jgi:hypothetical protein